MSGGYRKQLVEARGVAGIWAISGYEIVDEI